MPKVRKAKPLIRAIKSAEILPPSPPSSSIVCHSLSATSSESASFFVPIVAVLDKRRSSIRSREKENDSLDKLTGKFHSKLVLIEDRRVRKLRNITETLNQPVVTVEVRKRKVSENDGKTELGDKRKRKKSTEQDSGGKDEAAWIAESQENLKSALGRHYFDVRQRLNLDCVPSCLQNVAQCAELHARRQSQANRMNSRRQRDTKELLVENRPLQFLDYLEQALLRNEFVDSQLFVKALELILTINKPSMQLNADYDICGVLQHTVEILDRTVEQFPPCWLDLKTAYQGIIFGELEEDCFVKYGRSEGILKVVLCLMERCLERDDHQVGKIHSNERAMASFYLWEQENHQKYDFELLSREEKLERLFLVLQILVKILELDLSMWIMRHPHKAKENMINENRQPLIASVLWHEHSTVGEVNSLVKRIINLYVNVIALNYPADSIQVLSRFISVIGTAINLSEIQYDGTIDYPCIKDNTRYFARQISRFLESSGYYSVSLCLRLIEQMRSPLIRMILVDDFFQRLNHQTGPPSVASTVKHLAKERWKKYRPELPSEPAAPIDCRYPLLDAKRHKRPTQEISRRQYVNLLLMGFRSYMEVYPLQSYFQSLKRSSAIATNSIAPSSSSSPRTPSRQELKSNRYDFLALEKNIAKLSKQRQPNKTIVRSAAQKSHIPMVLEEVNLSPNVLVYYRDEIKHLLLIQRWLRMKAGTNSDNRFVFEPWKRYMATVDETLACE
ncbi:uncharacterized protein LOC131689279 [Topomyia yanbarensis]|uniref:uncharacterized protein LOC131689279 n=1 Tax=Topomyia yanbarensis TaxID=2498891 RepID=UPI00273CD1AF|nr:uncharacterized protein LOC131689279 [Topomyia yanbarensis]XP_058830241.1 uncharacterized protein LOC131689279 [Topomyia yanbarensis]